MTMACALSYKHPALTSLMPALSTWSYKTVIWGMGALTLYIVANFFDAPVEELRLSVRRLLGHGGDILYSTR